MALPALSPGSPSADLNAEALLAVTGLGPLLAGEPKRVTVADGEEAARIPLRIRRNVRRFLRGEKGEEVARPPFDYDALAGQLTREIPERVIARLLDTLPADTDIQGAYSAAVTRALDYLRAVIPLRSSMTTTGPVSRPPPGLELATFRRAWEVAEAPLTALADLTRGRLTGGQVRALEAIYPELYGAMRAEALDGIADIRGDRMSWTLPRHRDMQLQVLLGTPVVTPDLAADIARVTAPPPPDKGGSPPAGGPSSTASSLAPPSASSTDRPGA